MSQKYVTKLLRRDELYKDGDYSDVFHNKSRDSSGFQIHEYNVLNKSSKNALFK